MSRKTLSFFAVALMVVMLIAPVNLMAQANDSVKIDKELAEQDALLHRHDRTQEGGGDEDAEAYDGEMKEYEPNNNPNRLVVTLYGDPATTRAFNWFTTDRFESFVWISTSEDMADAVAFPAKVERVSSDYVQRDANGYFLFQKRNADTEELIEYFTDEGHEAGKWDHNTDLQEGEFATIEVDAIEEYSYKALAVNLEPGTQYFYQVGSEEGGKSDIGTFTTAKGGEEAFTFLQYTDTQNAYWNQHLIDEAAYGADTIMRALEANPEAEFVVHSGDIVEIAQVEDEWVDLFEQSKESFMKTTLMPVAGNHDEYGLSYDERFIHKFNQHFNVPAEGPIDGGSYYSVTYNNVHFINLNTNDYKNEDNKAIGEAQMEWLRWDVQQARANGAEWIILNFHKPLYSRSYHSLQDTDVQNVKEEFMKLIDELDIDLAMQGHDHVISRTHSLGYVPEEESKFFAKVVTEGEMVDDLNVLTDPEGTTFMLPNTGGTKAYDDIYAKGVDHVHKVRPKLDWLTQELIDEYMALFAYAGQPQETDAFEESHSNFRDSKVQNFAKYIVDGNTLTVELYQIEGDLDGERTMTMVDSFQIVKSK